MRLTSDHAPLIVDISIFEEHIQIKKHILVKNSKEEDKFVNKLIETIKEMNTKNICNKMSLIKLSKNLLVLQKDYGINIQKLSTSPNIQRSGEMNNVKEILNTFNNQDVSMTGKNLETPSRRQCDFFDSKIQEITNKSSRP